MTQEAHTVKTRIWDLPTRLFHIVLTLCVLGLVITGDNGDFAMAVHFYLGYTVLTLVFFRIIWGVVGGHWSRFATFIPSPSSLFSYLRNFKNPDAMPSTYLKQSSEYGLASGDCAATTKKTGDSGNNSRRHY